MPLVHIHVLYIRYMHRKTWGCTNTVEERGVGGEGRKDENKAIFLLRRTVPRAEREREKARDE